MKGKKYKRSENFMKKIFEKAFGLRQPYQVLVDGEFCRELLKCKIVAKDVLPEVLGGAIKVLASTCVLDELRRLDETAEDGLTGSIFLAKRFEIRNCRHSPSKCSTECMADLIGTENPHHYVAAVQNYELRKELRKVLGVPLVFINRGVVMMEDPSKENLAFAHEKELSKLKPKDFELKALAKAVQEPVGESSEENKKKKRKGKKQPNPLSAKKPKPKPLVQQVSKSAEEPHKPKRKRRSKPKATSV